VSAPVDQRRRPSSVKKVAASAVSFVAIAGLVFGMVGLLRSHTVAGLLLAGVVLVGGGIVLARLSWRLYRGAPSPWRIDPALTRDEVRALSRELARRQWLAVARFLVGLAGVYLLLALLLEDRTAALGAAALAAITAGGLGLMSWWQGTRTR
jgi:hypothetical protein